MKQVWWQCVGVVVLVVVGFASPARAQTGDAQDAYKEIIGDLPKRFESVMFYPEELERIDIVIRALKNELPVPALENEQEEEAPTQGPAHETYVYTFPQFYLTSIMYRYPTQWVIWLNHQKITAEKQHVIPGLTVDSITREQVILSYDFSEDRQIKPSETADPRIQIDFENRRVSVVLEPNQLFSLYSWRIFEGYSRPVTKLVSKASPFDPEKTVDGTVDLLRRDGHKPDNTKNRRGSDLGSILNQYKQLDGDKP